MEFGNKSILSVEISEAPRKFALGVLSRFMAAFQ